MKREKLYNVKDKGRTGSNRVVEMILNEGMTFENFFWMEGALPGDQGRRITVTHPGQVVQCSHCFGYSHNKYSNDDKCPAKGVGKGCQELKVKQRARMADYMLLLEQRVRYVSLKTTYCRKSPAVGNTFRIREKDGPEDDDKNDDAHDEETIVQNPIQKMSKEIEKLEKENENIKKQAKDMKASKEIMRNQSKLLLADEARINHASMLTEKNAVLAILVDTAPLKPDHHMLTMLALLQDRDQFAVEPTSGDITPISEESFLSNVTQGVTDFLSDNPEEPKEPFMTKVNSLKRQVIERMKGERRFQPGTTANPERRSRLVSRSRRSSTSSTASKRSRSREKQVEEENQSKLQKPGSPPPSSL